MKPVEAAEQVASFVSLAYGALLANAGSQALTRFMQDKMISRIITAEVLPT